MTTKEQALNVLFSKIPELRAAFKADIQAMTNDNEAWYEYADNDQLYFTAGDVLDLDCVNIAEYDRFDTTLEALFHCVAVEENFNDII